MTIDAITLRDTARDSIVSRKARYCYIPISKAANTNVKRLLWQAEHTQGLVGPLPKAYFGVHNYNWRFNQAGSKAPWKGMSKHAIEEFYQHLSERHILTVVRNPFTRLLSGYLDKIVSKIDDEPDVYKRFMLPRRPNDFADFVAMICDKPDSKVDIHFRLQSYANLFDYITYDHIGTVETLKQDFGIFSEKVFGQDYSHFVSQKADHSQNAVERLKHYYTPALIECVVDRFYEDFVNFGYDFTLDTINPVRKPLASGRKQGQLASAARFGADLIRHHQCQGQSVRYTKEAAEYLAAHAADPLTAYCEQPVMKMAQALSRISK